MAPQADGQRQIYSRDIIVGANGTRRRLRELRSWLYYVAYRELVG